MMVMLMMKTSKSGSTPLVDSPLGSTIGSHPGILLQSFHQLAPLLHIAILSTIYLPLPSIISHWDFLLIRLFLWLLKMIPTNRFDLISHFLLFEMPLLFRPIL